MRERKKPLQDQVPVARYIKEMASSCNFSESPLSDVLDTCKLLEAVDQATPLYPNGCSKFPLGMGAFEAVAPSEVSSLWQNLASPKWQVQKSINLRDAPLGMLIWANPDQISKCVGACVPLGWGG